eukprot:8673095-Heterocapsa_arctica.AAC.1
MKGVETRVIDKRSPQTDTRQEHSSRFNTFIASVVSLQGKLKILTTPCCLLLLVTTAQEILANCLHNQRYPIRAPLPR